MIEDSRDPAHRVLLEDTPDGVAGEGPYAVRIILAMQDAFGGWAGDDGAGEG